MQKYCHERSGRLVQSIIVTNYNFENIKEFIYFGTLISSDNDSTKELKSRKQNTNRCYYAL